VPITVVDELLHELADAINIMSLKARLIVVVVAFLASGVYVKFFSQPAEKKMVAKLQSATTNEVVASLGVPFKSVDASNFTARAEELAREGTPISNADMTAKGVVWLYADGGIKNTDVRNYRTVFFDENNRVSGIYKTYWAKDPWGSKL
jgi:hypothetical protein